MKKITEIQQYYNQFFNKYISEKQAVCAFKIIVALVLIVCIVKIFSCVLDSGVKIIKKIMERIKTVFKIVLFHNKDIILQIQKKYLKAPLVNKNDFFWIANLFTKKKVKLIVAVMRSSIFMLLHPKYIKEFFDKSIVAEGEIKQLSNEIEISINSFFIIPDKVTYAEINLKNKGDTIIYFATAKTKQHDFAHLNLYTKNSLGYQNVDYDDIENLHIITEGSIAPQSDLVLKVYFKTINRKTVNTVNNMSIIGSLRLKGSAKYIDYEIGLKRCKFIFDDNFVNSILDISANDEWIDIFKQGGLIAIVMPFFLLLFLLAIVIKIPLIQLIIVFFALLSYFIAVPLNVAIFQYVLDFEHKRKLEE